MVKIHPEEERMLKRLFAAGMVLVIIFSAFFAHAEVIKSRRIRVAEVHLLFPDGSPTEAPFVMTDFGPSNINFLEAVDIVVDKRGDLQGVRLIYTPGDGFRRDVYLHQVQGWILRQPRGRAISKEITVRIVTVDELIGY